MSETNGAGRILSLTDRRPMSKAGDYITRAQAEQIAAEQVVAECGKVHEYYLSQIPAFCGRMIQDALLHYGLIEAQAETAEGVTPLTNAASGDRAGASEEVTAAADGQTVPREAPALGSDVEAPGPADSTPTADEGPE